MSYNVKNSAELLKFNKTLFKNHEARANGWHWLGGERQKVEYAAEMDNYEKGLVWLDKKLDSWVGGRAEEKYIIAKNLILAAYYHDATVALDKIQKAYVFNNLFHDYRGVLDLSDLGLDELPDVFAGFNYLLAANLANNNLSEVPASLIAPTRAINLWGNSKISEAYCKEVRYSCPRCDIYTDREFRADITPSPISSPSKQDREVEMGEEEEKYSSPEPLQTGAGFAAGIIAATPPQPPKNTHKRGGSYERSIVSPGKENIASPQREAVAPPLVLGAAVRPRNKRLSDAIEYGRSFLGRSRSIASPPILNENRALGSDALNRERGDRPNFSPEVSLPGGSCFLNRDFVSPPRPEDRESAPHNRLLERVKGSEPSSLSPDVRIASPLVRRVSSWQLAGGRFTLEPIDLGRVL